MKKIKGKIRNYIMTNDNGNTTLQSLWDAAKAVLTLHLKELEKEEQS